MRWRCLSNRSFLPSPDLFLAHFTQVTFFAAKDCERDLDKIARHSSVNTLMRLQFPRENAFSEFWRFAFELELPVVGKQQVSPSFSASGDIISSDTDESFSLFNTFLPSWTSAQY